MKNVSNHIIHKVLLEVETKSEEKATQIKNNAGLLFQEELVPVLEELFDKYDKYGQVIRFDRLDIDFKVSDWSKRDELKIELLKSVEQKLSKIDSDEINKTYLNDDKPADNSVARQQLKTVQNYRQTFLFFIEKGYLPWYGKPEYIKHVLKPENWLKNLDSEYFVKNISELLSKSNLVLERIILQLSNVSIIELIKALGGIKRTNSVDLLKYLNNSETRIKDEILSYLLECSIQTSSKYPNKIAFFSKLILLRISVDKLNRADVIIDEYLEKQVVELECYFGKESFNELFYLNVNDRKKITINSSEFISATEIKGQTEEFNQIDFENYPTIISKEFDNSENEKEPPFFSIDTKEISIQNAGLVLFHPFLKTLFKNFDWILENGKIKEAYQFQAVQTLHYCATGSDVFFEYDLMLEKYLCGLSLQTPIPLDSLLNTEIKEEADNMLKAIVTHWQALQSTSPDGLRQMFVHRDGKLVQDKNGFRLIVERKAQDILLDSLPWNISIVKLPWKDDLLFVEW